MSFATILFMSSTVPVLGTRFSPQVKLFTLEPSSLQSYCVSRYSASILIVYEKWNLPGLFMSVTVEQEGWLNAVGLPSILPDAPKRPLHANVRCSSATTTVSPGIKRLRFMISSFVKMHLFLIELYAFAFRDGVPI
jgi:hypothetical protein